MTAPGELVFRRRDDGTIMLDGPAPDVTRISPMALAGAADVRMITVIQFRLSTGTLEYALSDWDHDRQVFTARRIAEPERGS